MITVHGGHATVVHTAIRNGQKHSYAHGEGAKKFFGAIGRGIKKAAKATWKGVVKAEQFVVKESKVVAKGVKTAGGKIKDGAKKLFHHKDKSTGQDVFKTELATFQPNQVKGMPGFMQVAADKFVKQSDVDPSKPVVLSVDPNTGKATVGQDYNADEVVAVAGDGNVQYFKDKDTEGMSKNVKIALIAGGVLVAAVAAYFMFKSKKK